MHEMLAERGMLDDSPVVVGYWKVLRQAASDRGEQQPDDETDDPIQVRYPPF